MRPERAIRGLDSRKTGGLKTFTNVNLLDDFSCHSEVVQQRLLIGYPDPEKEGDTSTEHQHIRKIYTHPKSRPVYSPRGSKNFLAFSKTLPESFCAATRVSCAFSCCESEDENRLEERIGWRRRAKRAKDCLIDAEFMVNVKPCQILRKQRSWDTKYSTWLLTEARASSGRAEPSHGVIIVGAYDCLHYFICHLVQQ